MTQDRLAFVGDVHGNAATLTDLILRLPDHLEQVVLLGDYINRGPDSRKVLDILVRLATNPRYYFLSGNHEIALLRALDTGDLGAFLIMGGATTIRSYLPDSAPPDVLNALRAAIPEPHFEFLRGLKERYEDKEVIAAHNLRSIPFDGRFRVAGHTPVGHEPRINSRSALVDTGSGMPNGRLTALLWPSLNYMQRGSKDF